MLHTPKKFLKNLKSKSFRKLVVFFNKTLQKVLNFAFFNDDGLVAAVVAVMSVTLRNNRWVEGKNKAFPNIWKPADIEKAVR